MRPKDAPSRNDLSLTHGSAGLHRDRPGLRRLRMWHSGAGRSAAGTAGCRGGRVGSDGRLSVGVGAGPEAAAMPSSISRLLLLCNPAGFYTSVHGMSPQHAELHHATPSAVCGRCEERSCANPALDCCNCQRDDVCCLSVSATYCLRRDTSIRAISLAPAAFRTRPLPNMVTGSTIVLTARMETDPVAEYCLRCSPASVTEAAPTLHYRVREGASSMHGGRLVVLGQ
jgi:hypothetical protein